MPRSAIPSSSRCRSSSTRSGARLVLTPTEPVEGSTIVQRAPERVEELRQRLLDGMAERGIGPAVAAGHLRQDPGLFQLRVPRAHAISFAYLVYASAWLKRYYPAAFTAALLRNQPMGLTPRTA